MEEDSNKQLFHLGEAPADEAISISSVQISIEG